MSYFLSCFAFVCNVIAFEGPKAVLVVIVVTVVVMVSRESRRDIEGWTAAARSEATPRCRLCYSPR